MRGIFKPDRLFPKALRPWIVVCCFALAGICGTCQPAYAQAAETPCPADKVCITREAAVKALHDADAVAADKIAIDGYKQVIEDLKAELNKMRVEFANVSGELSGAKQAAVRSDAIIELLLKNTKKKCMPLSICLN